MKAKFFVLFLWATSIIFSILWTFENPEKIEKIKSNFKKNEKTTISKVEKNSKNIVANSFTVEFEQILEVSDKTAFLIYPKNEKKFDISNFFSFFGYIRNAVLSLTSSICSNSTVKELATIFFEFFSTLEIVVFSFFLKLLFIFSIFSGFSKVHKIENIIDVAQRNNTKNFAFI